MENLLFTAWDKETSEVLYSGEASNPLALETSRVGIDVGLAGPTGSYRIGEGAFTTLPTQPSPHHEWDWTTKSWLPNLEAARESKLQQVATQLNQRLYLPCNGFDADKVSRERISGMIARLQRGDGLPAGWVGWRDASNDMHWAADDAATVLTSLTALSRAIEDREQALLISAWTHKFHIDNLPDDVGAILAYDITSGWPS